LISIIFKEQENKMAETLTKVKPVEDVELLKPSKYKVIVLNDDKTPVDFVIAMLVKIFKHGPAAAEEITIKIHHEGAGVAGIYSYEIAEQKVVEATHLAREHGFPLVLKAEQE
jgi:ATP-dependent Clp protease adaptor protein ClpS